MRTAKKNWPQAPAPGTGQTTEPAGKNLKFNDAEDSFELDVESTDGTYQHPDPYDTAAPSGEDDNSTYDEENPYTANEYSDKKEAVDQELRAIDDAIPLEDPSMDVPPGEVFPNDERDPLGDKQIQSDDPTENHG